MSLRNFSLLVTRRGPGTYVNGLYVAGSSSTFTIKASVQATNPKDLQALPEGRQNAENFTLYTDVKLKVAEPDSTKNNCDLVTINSSQYEVVACGEWQNRILPHYKVIVSKVTNG